MTPATALPPGWARAPLGEIATLLNGFAFKPSDWKGDGLPIIRIQNLNNPNAEFNYCPSDLPPKFVVRAGDLLFAWSGTPGTSFGAHIWRGRMAWLNQHIFRVEFSEEHLDKRFLRLAINHNLQDYISAAHGGAGLAHITKGLFERSQLLIPPFPEQHRIVAEIEKHLTRLDAAVAGLERVRANLKRYRASVLKAACEGRVVPTEAELARAEGRDYEPASALLARILDERRTRWEAEQLAKMRAAGKAPKDDGWKVKYPEPTPFPRENPPPLPEGWHWATVDQLSVVVRGASPRPAGDPRFFGGSIPWITVGALTADENTYLTQVSESVTEAGRQASRYVEPGTLLLTNSGVTLGVPKITLVGGCINDGSVALLHVDGPAKVYLHYFLKSQTRVLRAINQGAAQPNLNTGIVRAIRVPLPPLAEQHRIVDEVERRLSVVGEAERAVQVGLRRAERLRQAILKRAFEGKLVPQDPNDEPSSVLLERIRGEREQAVSPSRGPSGAPSLRSKRGAGNQAQLPLPAGT